MFTFAGIPCSQQRGQGHYTVSPPARWTGGTACKQPDGQTTQYMYVLHTSAALASTSTITASDSQDTKCKVCMAVQS